MLSAEQHREFAARGVVRLHGAVESSVVTAFRERLLAFVEKKKLAPSGSGQWLAVRASLTAPVAKACSFGDLWGPNVLAAVDDLLGAGSWGMPRHAGQILALTWPQPAQAWHVPDKSGTSTTWRPAPRAAFPGSRSSCASTGSSRAARATLVVAGTPRLIDAIRLRRGSGWAGHSADVRRALAGEVPWFRQLTSLRLDEDRIARFMEKPTEFEGSALQVVELVGDAGDVWLMHPWMLHAASANCSTRLRMVVTERLSSAAE